MSSTRGPTGVWRLRVAPPGPPAPAPVHAAVYPVDRDALARLRLAVTQGARECGLGEDGRDDLVLIANELATNVVRHGGGVGQMALWCEQRWMVCRISDHGPGIDDPREAGLESRSPDAVTGRGLWLVRQLGDWVDVASGPWGTAVTVAMNLPDGAGSRPR